MSSTLCIRKTPKPPECEEWHFKHPLKAFIGRRFYDHDGSLGGGMITIGPEHLSWFEGILIAGKFEPDDRRNLEHIVSILAEGDSIDVWFET